MKWRIADARPAVVRTLIAPVREERRVFKILATLKKRWLLLLLLGSCPAVLVLGFGLSNSHLPTEQRPAEAKPWRTEAKRYLDANNYVKAEQLLQKAAQAGDPDAMGQLGLLYLDGPALYRDYAQAREWFQKAAAGGNAAAKQALARLPSN